MFTKSQFEELWNEILESEEYKRLVERVNPIRAMLGLLSYRCPHDDEYEFEIPNLNKLSVREFIERWLKEARSSETVYEVVSKKYEAAGEADVYYFDYDYATVAPIYAIRTIEGLKDILEVNLKEE